MATTTNYGWDTPDNSGLVKNGAQDIRTLGSAIDTSLWNIGFGQAGKNRIINGDFNINQRSFTSRTTNGFGFDRFEYIYGDGTVTYSAQTFTPGAAPVAGYEAANFARIATASQTTTGAYAIFQHKIEDVRTFAGQTATLSFWAKATTGTPKVAFEIEQVFGSGGSPSGAVGTYAGQVTLSTSWARYSVTVNVPSISGKTIGTSANTSYLLLNLWTSAGSSFNSRTGSIGIQNSTIDFWGVQLEYGSKATPFETATGTIQGELAACQRYYWRSTATDVYSPYGLGYAHSTTNGTIYVQPPVQMRVRPTSVDFSNLSLGIVNVTGFPVTSLAISTSDSGTHITCLNCTTAGTLTQFRPYGLNANNTTSSFVGLSAEL